MDVILRQGSPDRLGKRGGEGGHDIKSIHKCTHMGTIGLSECVHGTCISNDIVIIRNGGASY